MTDHDGEIPEPVDSMFDQTVSATKRVTLIFPRESDADDSRLSLLKPFPFASSGIFGLVQFV